MMKTKLNIMNFGKHFRLRSYARVRGRDWALYFACLICFGLVLAAGNWVAAYSAGDELETWLKSSATFVVLAILTRFSARLRGWHAKD